MNSEIRAALLEIAELLEEHQEYHYARAILDALQGRKRHLKYFSHPMNCGAVRGQSPIIL